MATQSIPAEAGLDDRADNSSFLTEIIRQAQLGSRFAFERLYREHAGRIYALCLRMAADMQRAEELTQEVFIRTWGAIGTFRGECPFSAWLHRLAVNVVLVDFRTNRRRSARVMSSGNPEQYEKVHSHAHPGAAIDLEEAIASLPPQARAIFVLHDVEGFTHEEIAKSMELAVGTSKAQLHRARKLLREVLSK